MNAKLVSISKSCETQQHTACRGVEWTSDMTPKWACSCSCHVRACSVCRDKHGFEIVHACE